MAEIYPIMDVNIATILADEGMERAARHADRVEPRWCDRAHTMLLAYARTHEYFQAEHVRLSLRAQGLPDPPEPRAWGSIFKDAAKDGIISATHYAPSYSPTSHGRPMMVWKSNLYARD